MFAEDELLPLSALQHLVFCERQFALIHVERLWAENVKTVEGRRLHDQAHGGDSETRGEIRVARSLPLRSLRLGLVGQSDVVEFHRDLHGASLANVSGGWRPFPVEYKRGRPKAHRADEIQLAAQALCLEEMLATEVPGGALFYGETRRRVDVTVDTELRGLVEVAARRARELLERRETPPARREPKCEQCSLLELCRPEAASRSARRYLDSGLRSCLAGEAEGDGR